MWVLALLVAVTLAQYPESSAQTRPGVCSNFAKVFAAYPGDDLPSDELLESLGGGMIGMANTCTIRATIALRSLGLEAGEIGNAVWRDAKKRKYLIRVLEMNQFLRATFGPPQWVGGPGTPTDEVNDMGEKVYLHPPQLRGNAGMIRYSDCPFSDASGHIDVFDGQKLKGHGYAHKCRKMEVWNLCNPVPNPDYRPFIAYMRGTTGWDPRGSPRLPEAALPAQPNGRPAPPAASMDLKRAQQLLNTLSERLSNAALNVGVADGIAGRRTAAGVAAFQRLASLPVTGVINQDTYDRLVAY